MTFWIPWGIDVVVAAVFAFFFFAGLADGTVSSFNMGLWLTTLGALAGVLGGSFSLRANGRLRPAIALAWTLAVPSLLTGLFFLALIIVNPRWN